MSGELWKTCSQTKIERTELVFRFASRLFITINFQPAACFLLARETKALFFPPSFSLSLSLLTLSFVFSCHFYKAGSVTCFLIRRSNNFDKSFRLPARPFCYYKSSLKSLSLSFSFSCSLDPPLHEFAAYCCAVCYSCWHFRVKWSNHGNPACIGVCTRVKAQETDG